MLSPSFKKTSFYLIAILLPICILLGIEGFLRLIDYKPTEPLFIQSTAIPGYLQPNDNVIHRYFARPDLAPNVSPDTQYFLQDKPTDSLRIVVQGGSTAAGFPYGRWGSLSGMLQQQFKRLYPEKQIEIINTAMASVNTYTLLDFVDEIIEIEPDIVLIYAGHNEYLGIMGVGSAYASRGGRAANLLYLKLKNLKLYRLVESLYYGLFARSSDNQDASQLDERTLMAKIAKDKNIAYQSDVFEAGVAQFKGNLSLLLTAYQQAGIPVVLGDLVSNEKDLVPFSALMEFEPKRIQAMTVATPQALQQQVAQIKQRIATPVNVEQRNMAEDYFLLGHAYHALGELAKAKAAFVKAKDYDQLRFRAPSEFNAVIEELALQYQVPQAGVQEAFFADSSDGIIGSKHMLEHLHPTVRGYFVLADAYVKAMLQNGLLPNTTTVDTELSWQEQPVSQADAAYGEFKVARLTGDYPFTRDVKTIQLPEVNSIENEMLVSRVKGTDWLSINQTLLRYYQKQNNIPEAAKVAGLLADALPNNGELTYIAGMLYKQANNILLSNHHLMRAVKLNTNPIRARLSLAQNYFLLQQFNKSLQLLNEVKRIQPDHPQVLQFIKMVEQAKRTNK